MMYAKQLSQKLAERVQEISEHLLPQGKRVGNEWCVGDMDGNSGKSLKVHLAGTKAGIWCDFATGEKGDLLDLWALKRNLSVSEAMKDATRYLGITFERFHVTGILKFVKPAKICVRSAYDSDIALEYLMNVRKLTKDTIQAFKIGFENNEIILPYWREGELISQKYLSLERPNGKKKIRVEANCEPCLFGWHTIPDLARRVIICEGEIDAMSFYQYGIPALSVPFGGGNNNGWIDQEFDRLARFDQIYICMDNDAVGIKGAQEIADRLGRFRCKLVDLPMKDINECLQNGLLKEDLVYYLKESKTCDPKELADCSTYEDTVVKEWLYPEESHKGYYSPWKKTAEDIRFRPNELSIWTGTNGHGKSQMLSQVILDQLTQGARICVASLELRPYKFIKRMTIQATTMRNPSEEYIRTVLKFYSQKLWLLTLSGKEKAKLSMEVFEYARLRYGIDVFVIDPFAKLGISQDDYQRQTTFIEELCDFKERHNCHIHLVVHPRKGPNEYSTPGKLDIKGTGTITDLADNCFSVWRNKEKEQVRLLKSKGELLKADEEEKLLLPDVRLRCDKQRDEDGREGVYGFWFDNDSLQYLESEFAKPRRYVNYSCLENDSQ